MSVEEEDYGGTTVLLRWPKGTIIMPAWCVILFAALFVVSGVCLVLVLAVESQMVGEVRVMQIYEEDIESVLIRANIATRSDFAPHPHKAQEEGKK